MILCPHWKKSDEDVLNDLQTRYTDSVRIEGSENFVILAEHVSFDRTGSEEINDTHVKKVHSFSIGEAAEGSYSLERIVPAKATFDFDVENAFDMYDENGSYQVTGNMNIVYELIEDEETGELSWMITDVETDVDSTKVSKL